MDDNFLSTTEGFLHCKVASVSFKYLGLSVGGNPRRESTWVRVLDGLQNMLISWKNRCGDLGGRIVSSGGLKGGGKLLGSSGHRCVSLNAKEGSVSRTSKSTI